MSKPQFESSKIVANQCRKHYGKGNQLVGSYPDVQLCDEKFIILNAHPVAEDTWDGPVDVMLNPYVIVLCLECFQVTVHYYGRTFWGNQKWATIRPTRWRKRVDFICAPTSANSFVLERILWHSWSLFRPFYDVWFPVVDLPVGEGEVGLPETVSKGVLEVFELARERMIGALIHRYVQRKDDFRKGIAECLTKGTFQFSNLLERTTKVRDQELHLLQTNSEYAGLFLEAAQHMYDNKLRHQQSGKDLEMRLKLAHAARALGIKVPPELLVDRSSKKPRPNAQVQSPNA